MSQRHAGRLDVDGPVAPPRANGELLFAEPWESRVFGVTMALHEAGVFDWDDFRRLLIDEIQRWQAADHPPEQWRYYECWRAALERLLSDRNLIGTDELAAKARAFAERPAGHDHGHDHGH